MIRKLKNDCLLDRHQDEGCCGCCRVVVLGHRVVVVERDGWVGPKAVVMMMMMVVPTKGDWEKRPDACVEWYLFCAK